MSERDSSMERALSAEEGHGSARDGSRTGADDGAVGVEDQAGLAEYIEAAKIVIRADSDHQEQSSSINQRDITYN